MFGLWGSVAVDGKGDVAKRGGGRRLVSDRGESVKTREGFNKREGVGPVNRRDLY